MLKNIIHVIKKQNQARSYNITPVSNVFILLQAPTVESHDHMGEPNEESALRLKKIIRSKFSKF